MALDDSNRDVKTLQSQDYSSYLPYFPVVLFLSIHIHLVVSSDHFQDRAVAVASLV